MSVRRNALGRGLGALIPGRDTPPSRSTASASPAHDAVAPSPSPAAPTAVAEPAVARGRLELPVDLIDPNPEQPRRHFDSQHLEQLAASILQHGVLQPVVVRRAGERYELIVGERRWRASRAAGLRTIPAVVADVEPRDRLEIALVENVQRHDLNPIELAHAYRALAEAGSTQDEIGRRVSLDRSSIANHLRLLDLARDIQEDVEQGRLTMGHAKALLQVGDSAQQHALRDRIVKEGLSVRATELLGRQLAGPARARKAPAASDRHGPDLGRVLDDLQRRYQTRVQLRGNERKGRIEIDYYDTDELNRILSLMLGESA